jgi:putative membrane protein
MKLSAVVTLALTSALAFVSTPASAQAVNDAQIASIVVTANQVDVDAGKFAAARTKNEAVRKFAELMVTDHTGVNKSAIDLATRLKVTPQDNPTSQALKTGGEKNIATLKTLSGTAFDTAYVDHEVSYHQQVLDAVDTVLIPGASNAELKALLVKVRPAFVAHLEHAKHVQASLKTDEKAAAARTHVVRTHVVTIAGMEFTPATLDVVRGDTVVWINKDIVPHTATAASGKFDSGKIEAQNSWRYLVRSSGRFSYACSYHPTMTGLVAAK